MQSLRHNPNGRFVTVCGDGEYVVYTALAWRNKSFGRCAVWPDHALFGSTAGSSCHGVSTYGTPEAMFDTIQHLTPRALDAVPGCPNFLFFLFRFSDTGWPRSVWCAQTGMQHPSQLVTHSG
jgi:hypothetical protein